VKLLQDPVVSQWSIYAIYALACKGVFDRHHTGVFVELMRNEDTYMRSISCGILLRLTQDCVFDPSSLEAATTLLDDEDVKTKCKAAQLIGHLAEEGIHSRNCLSSLTGCIENIETRPFAFFAAYKLASKGIWSPELVEKSRLYIYDKDANVREFSTRIVKIASRGSSR
jgi:hypothetical protein